MKPKVIRMECPKADWIRVVNAARRTWGRQPIDHEPKDSWKKEILLAEHSPIRLLEYDFTIADIRQWVTVHLVRHHVGCEKFIRSQRQDINSEVEKVTKEVIDILREEGVLREGWLERDYMFQGEINDMDMTCNAQAFINISRKRLCYGCASPETREAWRIVIKALREVDPILASVCVPDCIYRGFCTERNRSCGYADSPLFQRELETYRKAITDESKD